MARGDVVYVQLPLVSGSRVQGGSRPSVLVIADNALHGNPMRMVVPLTSNLSVSRFPFTLRIDPSPTNGLSVSSIALVFQLCAADVTHLGNVKGKLEQQYIEKINEMMRQMLGL